MDIGLPAPSPSRVNFMPLSPQGRLAGRFEGGELNSIDHSISDLLGNSIWTKPEKKVDKEVAIKFPAAVVKENNRSSINSAQKADRTAKSAPNLRGKPDLKPSTKCKRTETEVETPSPRKLRKRA
jgi:hypothetical protein